jgi:hypothetical protein
MYNIYNNYLITLLKNKFIYIKNIITFFIFINDLYKDFEFKLTVSTILFKKKIFFLLKQNLVTIWLELST